MCFVPPIQTWMSFADRLRREEKQIHIVVTIHAVIDGVFCFDRIVGREAIGVDTGLF